MDNGYEQAFYVDTFHGVVKEGHIVEIEKDGLWIMLKGESMNTFVHADMIDRIIYKQRDEAEAGLGKIRSEMKAQLLQNNLFINEIHEKLEHVDGKLYADIIREILLEKI